MIFDCGGDGKVQSDIRERFDSLKESSFSLVIGIRDVYPDKNMTRIRHYLYFGIPATGDIPVKIILAIQEIEAWFLAEETHYPIISERITLAVANEIARNEIPGIDLSMDSTETIPHPSETLKQIYIKGKTTYDKSKEKVERTVGTLSYENLYINIRQRNSSLNELLTCLDELIS